MLLALIAALCIALVSLMGAFLFGSALSFMKTSRIILPIAVGTFLSVVFVELIPETLEKDARFGSMAIIVGFLFFYALSHVLRTYHHHHTAPSDCEHVHAGKSAPLILMGDAIHNFADGIVIASAFLIDPTVGMVTAIGIALHEIPQEIAEFGILLQTGYSKGKAAFYNFISASSVLVGVLFAWFFLTYAENFMGILIGLAAGIRYSAKSPRRKCSFFGILEIICRNARQCCTYEYAPHLRI
jgi:zinc and cadmium transporter